MDELKRRLGEAEFLLNNDEFKRALTEYRAALMDVFLACDKKDDLARYRIQVALDVVKHIEDHLKTVIAVAGSAAKQAQEFEEKRFIPRIF